MPQITLRSSAKAVESGIFRILQLLICLKNDVWISSELNV